jgi:hypothetical protein
MRVSHHPFLFLAALALSACGGAEPAATTPAATGAPVASGAPAATPPAATAAAAAAIAPLTGPFDSGSNEQKLNHMKTVIQPTMGAIFKTYDGKKYGEFGCRTCHGEKKEDPHRALPKLTLSGDGFKKLAAEKPELMKFMSEQVTPAMAKAMNDKPYDPATHKGFGCGGCHSVN